VRVTLGATRGNVLRMILGEALGLLGLGMVLGTVGVFFSTRFVTGMLYNVSAFDPATLLLVAGALLVVTLLAAMIPALRAAMLDPVETLRAE
jgi:ABC-type antimicrobial peptide transport system permease subunit